MAESQTAKRNPRQAAKRTAGKKAFTQEERAAMRERAREAKAGQSRADGERALLAKIAEMGEADRAMAERVHALVTAAAPDLVPRTWYGMPAYADAGDVVCFFQDAGKFKTRYATFGFSDKANLDNGGFWPIAYALSELTPDVEKKLAALVKRAVRSR